jgi:hypothetical protein
MFLLRTTTYILQAGFGKQNRITMLDMLKFVFPGFSAFPELNY